jgi:ribonucleoside-diphosphate reductase alpha chain
MKIKKITKTNTKVPTYDIEVEHTHNYYLKCGDTNLVSHNSAVVSNATNGIEPPRTLVSFKKSKKGVLPQVVPDIHKYKKYYTTAFEMKSNKGYLRIAAVIQKFIDQGISVNCYYNPTNYEDGNIPISVIMEDQFYHYSLGGKTMYYANTYDGREEKLDPLETQTIIESSSSCEGGACSL